MSKYLAAKLIVLGKVINSPSISKLGRRFLQRTESGLGHYSIEKIMGMDRMIEEIDERRVSFHNYVKYPMSWARTFIDEKELYSNGFTVEGFVSYCIDEYIESKVIKFESQYGESLSSSIPEFLPNFLEEKAFPFGKDIFMRAIKNSGNKELYKDYISKDMYSMLGVQNIFYIIDNGEEFFLNFFKNIFHEFQHNIVNPKAHEIFLQSGSSNYGDNYNLLDVVDETFTLASGAFLDPSGSSYSDLEKRLLYEMSINTIEHLKMILGGPSMDPHEFVKKFLFMYNDIIQGIDKIDNRYIDSEKKKNFIKDVLAKLKKIIIEYEKRGRASYKTIAIELNNEIVNIWDSNMIDFVTNNHEDLLIEFSRLLDENIDILYKEFLQEVEKHMVNVGKEIVFIMKNEAEDKGFIKDI